MLLASSAAYAAPASPQLIGKMWVLAPPSWSAPVVPRMVADADSAGPVLVSDSLISFGST